MRKVIVADCSPSVCTLVRSVFPEPEFTVYPFSDGAELLGELEEINPDVILLNLYLHSKDGYDVCRFLNSKEHFQSIPVFLFRGAFERVDDERIKDLNYRELIAEPFDSGRLLQKVREILGGEQEPSSLPEEPVFAGDREVDVNLEARINAVVSEHLRGMEGRIVSRLREDQSEGRDEKRRQTESEKED